MPVLKFCLCVGCGHEWRDYPGMLAKLTRPQFHGDTRNGCPGCGGLYWAEADSDSGAREMAATLKEARAS